jgi:DUF4097 and DUF4098 domain-containing protein YvlB
MRRGSLIGPILLIIIGGLFLVNNLRPDMPLLELAARYWPFLLIGWGALRLIEILVWAIRSQPLPRAGISGGEWAVVVLICLIGSGTDFARTRLPHARITMHGIDIFGEAYDFQSQGRQPAGEASRVLVENLYGHVRIVGADSEEVVVEGRTTVRAFNESGAEEAHEECPLEVFAQGDQIVVRTNQDRLSGAGRITTDLEITVPKGASIQGRGRYGDFDVSSVEGDVEIESDNAGVRLAEIGGNARISLEKSDIVRLVNLKGTLHLEGRGEDVELEDIEGQVTINGSYFGELLLRNLAKPLQFESKRTEFHVEKAPGQIRITRGDITGNDLVGPIRLKTRSRDVRLSDFTEELVIELDRGDVELRPGKLPIARMEVEIESGDIELALPEAASFGLLATTERGEVVNEFGSALEEETEGRGAVLKGPEGREPSIRLNTGRGTIIVTKASGESAPAKARKTGSVSVSLEVERH